MEDVNLLNNSKFRNLALNRTYHVDVYSKGFDKCVLSYSGLSVFDVQEFLILVDSNCFLKITCDSEKV